MRFVFQILLGVLCVLSVQNAFSQNTYDKIDVFKNQLRQEKNIPHKLVLYDSIITEYLQFDKNTAAYYELEAIQLAADTENDSIILAYYLSLSEINSEFNLIEKSIKLESKALEVALKMGKLLKAAEICLQQELHYDVLGKYPKSMEMAQQALGYYKEINDTLGIATCLNDIGIVHYYLGQYDNALDYLRESLDLHLAVKDSSGIANCYNNIANVFSDKEEYEKALTWYFKGLKIDKEEYGRSISMSNIGETYLALGDTKNAEKYLTESLRVAREINDAWTITNPLRALSDLYLHLKQYDKAIKFAEEGVVLADSIGAMQELSDAYAVLAEIHKAKKNYAKALEYFERYEALKDSIFNKENATIISEMESKYQSEQKNAEIKLLKSMNELEEMKNQEAVAKNKRETTYWIIGASIFFLFSVFILWSLITNRKANTSLKHQKDLVEEKNTFLNRALEEIEEKNKEITDSINYAKRIQTAILPSNNLMKDLLPNSFVLYKPKDIVAGDFYWLESMENNVLLAVADCTGHGVPGAMVSVVCNNGLNRAVQEFQLSNPGEILNKTNEIVSAQFAKSGENVKDGMDISLCSLRDSQTAPELEWAGANNPLWIVSKNCAFYDSYRKNDLFDFFIPGEDGSFGIIEVKPDKQPIGLFSHKTPFVSHNISLQKGDILYLFSDGYPDQFGGDKGKKLKHKNFKTLLLSIHNEPMDSQKALLNKQFEDWKGEIEQIDDVCIIGVRV